LPIDRFYVVVTAEQEGAPDMHRNVDKIRGIVADEVGKNLDLRVLDVEIDFDRVDDEDVLRIDVILENAPKKVDGKKLSGFSRRLHSKLLEIKETAFPLLYFIERSDLPRKRAAG
jgi:hypothetical protein